MSKSHDYTFYKSHELHDWGGNVISRDLCDKLQVGDIVRLCLCSPTDPDEWWVKYYFEITKIDYYKYGNTSKIRKFHGKVRNTYVMEWHIIGPEHTTTFRKEDIYEIPGWKTDYNPLKKQDNFDIITQEQSIQRMKDMKRRKYEDELERQKRQKNKKQKDNYLY